MSVIYNATQTFMNLGYTDVTIFYFLTAIAVLFMIVSRLKFDQVNSFGNVLFSFISFCMLVSALFMSANIATFQFQPTYIENQSAWDGYANVTTSHTYTNSVVEVIPENSVIVSITMIILTVFSLLNFGEILFSLMELNKVKSVVKR